MLSMLAIEMKGGGMKLLLSIGEVSFNFYPREANKVAHELARFEFDNSLSCNWVDVPPRFLLDSLINDVIVH
jgi:hypothetical protein